MRDIIGEMQERVESLGDRMEREDWLLYIGAGAAAVITLLLYLMAKKLFF